MNKNAIILAEGRGQRAEGRGQRAEGITAPFNKNPSAGSFSSKVFRVLSRKFKRVRYGRDSISEFFLFLIDNSCYILFRKNPEFYGRSKVRKFKEFIKDDAYYIKDAKIPRLNKEDESVFFGYVFEDTFYSYLYLNDKYDEETVDLCDLILCEGLYGLKNNLVDVTVKPNDVVIDAGSWIGDFAAYASTVFCNGGGGGDMLCI